MNLRDALGGAVRRSASGASMTVAQARAVLEAEEVERLVDRGEVEREAVARAQESGIVFLDEIDKIAAAAQTGSGPDVSREGVQRDLLPLVEGTTVTTRYGAVSTDHVLFIAAGAFHVAKPSDLIPELQGRFPVRVQLEALVRGGPAAHPDRAGARPAQAAPGAAGRRRGRAGGHGRGERRACPHRRRAQPQRPRTSAPVASRRSSSGYSTRPRSPPPSAAAPVSCWTPPACARPSTRCWAVRTSPGTSSETSRESRVESREFKASSQRSKAMKPRIPHPPSAPEVLAPPTHSRNRPAAGDPVSTSYPGGEPLDPRLSTLDPAGGWPDPGPRTPDTSLAPCRRLDCLSRAGGLRAEG